jgi:AraC-like ligand binding domain
MPRKRMLLTFKEAPARGAYDEYPVLPADVDPQLHLSRNDRVQPFYLSCSKDTVVVQMAGAGRVEFRDASVNYFDIGPGDHVCVPADTVHRLHPDATNTTYRYRAQIPGPEALLWFCERCETQLFRYDYDGSDVLVQTAYADGCEAFNASPRACASCGNVHAAVDTNAFHWRAIAEEIGAEESAGVELAPGH